MGAVRIAGRDHAQVKGFVAGTHRSRTPDATLADYQRCMRPLGITRLANITGLDFIGVPVYVAVRPTSRGLATAQGKGIDVASAKASALMESIESWHGENITRPLRYESHAWMRRHHDVVDVRRLPAVVTGAKLSASTPMLWIEGYDLLAQRAVWVPHESVTTNFVRPRDHVPLFLQSSNGLASGNHLLEAVVHGLCEVIERDAVALWKLLPAAEVEGTRLDVSSVDDPLCRELLARLARAGVAAAIWDATSDLGIPAYVCSIYESSERPNWRRLGVFGGYGCHLAPEVALMRAVSEAIQGRLTFIAGSRDDIFYREFDVATEPEALELVLSDLARARPSRRFGARPSLATPTLEGDVHLLLAALRDAGIDSVVVVDLTHDALGVPVVKVVVPGLEACMPGVQPGERARRRSVSA